MNVYAVGAYGYKNLGDDSYANVLRARLPAIWSDLSVHFHRFGSVPFAPDDFDALVLGGGGLFCRYVAGCGTDNLEYFLRYPATMQLFRKRSFAIGLGVQGSFRAEGMERFLPTIDSMALRTVRDPASARMLRAAGVRSPVLTCADLAYLLPCWPRVPDRLSTGGAKPVLGVVASQPDKNVVHPEYEGFEKRIIEALKDLENDFELRFLSLADHADGWLRSSWPRNVRSTVYDPYQPSAVETFLDDFRKIDVCLTTRLHGLIFSVLNEIPSAAIGAPGEKVERECAALGASPFLSYESSAKEMSSAVRSVFETRCDLESMLSGVRSRRVRLAQRNIDLLAAEERRAAGDATADRAPDPERETLVIWAAGDEFWDEVKSRMDCFGAIDCLVQAGSQLHPANIRNRFALPAGVPMHCDMMPSELVRHLDQRYENVVLCHASSQTGAVGRLQDLAVRSGRQVWEFGLWTHTMKKLSQPELKGLEKTA